MSPFREGYIYRLCCARAWEGIAQSEHIPYSPDDARDGFFHMSAPGQVIETAVKHYIEFENLVAVGCPEDAPGDLLKWEESRGGEKFPHIHGDAMTAWFDHVVPLNRQGGTYVPVAYN